MRQKKKPITVSVLLYIFLILYKKSFSVPRQFWNIIISVRKDGKNIYISNNETDEFFRRSKPRIHNITRQLDIYLFFFFYHYYYYQVIFFILQMDLDMHAIKHSDSPTRRFGRYTLRSVGVMALMIFGTFGSPQTRFQNNRIER